MAFNYHHFAKKKNKIYCWGCNFNGELGLGVTCDNINKPVEFKIEGNLFQIKQIIYGLQHVFAICENKKIYCWEIMILNN